jgi:hypothetical protein
LHIRMTDRGGDGMIVLAFLLLMHITICMII